MSNPMLGTMPVPRGRADRQQTWIKFLLLFDPVSKAIHEPSASDKDFKEYFRKPA